MRKEVEVCDFCLRGFWEVDNLFDNSSVVESAYNNDIVHICSRCVLRLNGLFMEMVRAKSQQSQVDSQGGIS